VAEDAAEPHQKTERETAKFAFSPGVGIPIAFEPAEGEQDQHADGNDDDEDREHDATLT